MKNYFSFLVNNHQAIFRYIFLGLVVALISYSLPTITEFNYQFKEGDIWQYDDLYAPFDFEVDAPEEELAELKREKRESFTPYYKRDTDIEKAEKQEFLKGISVEYEKMKGKFLGVDFAALLDTAKFNEAGLNILSLIYDKGILKVSEEDQQKNNFEFYFEVDNIYRLRRPDDFFTLKTATEEISAQMAKQGGVPATVRDLMVDALAYNVGYDALTTERQLTTALDSIVGNREVFGAGQRIIAFGDKITSVEYNTLVALQAEYESREMGDQKKIYIYLSNLLLTALIVIVFSIFLFTLTPEVFLANRKVIFIFTLITIVVVAMSNIVKTDYPALIYVLPLTIVPIILRSFFGANVALYAHVCLVLFCNFIVSGDIAEGYVFLQIIAGLVAIYSTKKAYYISQFFMASAQIFLTYEIGNFALAMLKAGNLTDIDYSTFGWLGLNVLLTMLAYPLIPVFEKIFGFVSETTLLELSDINKPMLKDLSLKAPGTFNHSLSVANLAEAAAYEIGANALLTKVGALYHDIGKGEDPIYYIENQREGMNPHDDLPYQESAKIIVGHVTKGVDIAKKHRLPDIIIDFIRTHHGTTRVEYFYRKYKEDHPDIEVDESIFRYPGPVPYSKETAILMMADSVEAASRAMKDHTAESIDQLVDGLIDHKIQMNQLVNSDITFKEITTVKKVLKKMLGSIYHVRIAYPEEK